MDSFELNKILGAILGTLLFVMALGFIAEAIYAPRASGPGYDLPAPSGEASGAPAPVVAVVDIGTLLAKADPKAGEAAAKKCESCHDFTENGPNKIGPNLYDVVDRARATHPGFDYSGAMKAKGGNWTYDELFKYLKSPQSYVPGTKMSFAGISSEKDRINLIAYLRSNADAPAAIPAPAPKAAAAPAADAAKPADKPAAGADAAKAPAAAAPAAEPEKK